MYAGIEYEGTPMVALGNWFSRPGARRPASSSCPGQALEFFTGRNETPE